MYVPFQPEVSITLTLKLFKTSFQDVRVLHLINKCCWGQAGLSIPVVPLHGLRSCSLSQVILSDKQPMGVFLHSTAEQTFPTKTYQVLYRVFRKIKVLYIPNAFLSSQPCNSIRRNTSLKKFCRLFSSSFTVPPCPMKAPECKGGGVFQRIVWKNKEQNIILFHILLWNISQQLWSVSRVKTLSALPRGSTKRQHDYSSLLALTSTYTSSAQQRRLTSHGRIAV